MEYNELLKENQRLKEENSKLMREILILKKLLKRENILFDNNMKSEISITDASENNGTKFVS